MAGAGRGRPFPLPKSSSDRPRPPPPAGRRLPGRGAPRECGAPTPPVWPPGPAEPYPVGDDAAVGRLLVDQVTEGVRFVEQVESMYARGVRVFVEAGPGRVLTQSVGKILGDRPHTAIACDASGEPGLRRFLLALAELASTGVAIDPAMLFEGRAQRLDLTALPAPTPGWSVDGALVRRADGTVLPNSLQPSDTLPALAPSRRSSSGAHMTHPSDDPTMSGYGVDPGVVVHEYLRSVRQLVAAERDVMLRYLGAEVPATDPSLLTPAGPGVEFGVAPAERAPPAAQGAPAPAPAPGAGATAVATPAPESVVPALTTADLMAAVQQVVAARTGYPVEMLEPDLDLEADLSIDSIKRLEIVGELADTLGLGNQLAGGEPDDALVEELAKHKTLRAVVTWLEENLLAPAAAPAPATPAPVHSGSSAPLPSGSPAPDLGPANLREVIVDPLGPTLPTGDLAGRHAAVLLGHEALSDAVAQALSERGAAGTVLAPLDVSEDHDGQAAALLGEVDALVDLSATVDGVDARAVFTHLRPALLGAASRVLAVAPALHGDGTPTGVAGLVRSAAREKADKMVRAVEIEATDLAGEVDTLAAIVVDELLDLEAPLTLSWAGGLRTTKVTGAPSAIATPDSVPLQADSVVLLTGGARGITARVAADVARASGCRLVLVGRSALPGPEDARLADADGPADLRRALLTIGELRTPAEIEAACTRILADREIRATMAALAAHAASVEYVAADVRSPRFGEVLDDVRRRYGRLDVVVHGAGVLDDRFIADKSEAGFDLVYGTKVEGARTILERQAGLAMVVLFGSVSGVFGNRGQVDYAAANDALDALARAHDGRHGCRVISLDWGPWGGGGMVSADLEREYARRGIGLVDPRDGTAALLSALSGALTASQFVVMAGDPEAFAPGIGREDSGALTR